MSGMMKSSNTTLEEKKKLRSEMRSKRMALSIEEVRRLSDALTINFIEFFESKKLFAAKTFALYAEDENEVALRTIAIFLLAKGKHICYPKLAADRKLMGFFEVRSLDKELSPGAYGILEPIDGMNEVPADELDVIIVPGVAFSKEGARLGRGGGFYDSVLNACKGLKLALAYSFQMQERIPHEAHDVFMDYVLTENNIY